MRHFAHLTGCEGGELFCQLPGEVHRGSPRVDVANALGATLYVPATRPALADAVLRQARAGVTSVVVCLEDAIPDESLPLARLNTIRMLDELADSDPDVTPLLFARTRTIDDAAALLEADRGQVLSGIAIPKFDPESGPAWLQALRSARTTRHHPIYAMPILESSDLLAPPRRGAWLSDVHQVLSEHPDLTLALRIGTTDIAGAGSLRRSRGLTIYALSVVADVIAAILGEFIVDKATVPAITAGVWEHYPASSISARPRLRQTLFAEPGRASLHQELTSMGLKTLVDEIFIDLANGMRGKAVIHPSHVALVNSLHTVEWEEFVDAEDILVSDGAHASLFSNKMNESKPHRAWAHEILTRSRAFGVLSPGVSWVDVLGITMDAADRARVPAI